MKTAIIIPARYNSTRFPGKLLKVLGNKPVIQWVWEAAKKVPNVDVYIATCDLELRSIVENFGAIVITTGYHLNGTSRVKEAYSILKKRGRDYDTVINLQGDEPFIDPDDIERMISSMKADFTIARYSSIVSLYYKKHVPEYANNPHIVKVKLQNFWNAIDFKRIVDAKDQECFKHIGVYGFPTAIIDRLPIAKEGELEQCIWLKWPIEIVMIPTTNDTISIDTPEDLERANDRINPPLPKQHRCTIVPLPHFTLIAGPCVVEDEDMALEIAQELICMVKDLNIKLIYKASYVKANRTSINSFSTIGEVPALKTLQFIQNAFPGMQVLTDVHSPYEIPFVSSYVDILQIPAFLCRQTDLLITAGKTMKPINVKKGQFLSGESMKFVIEKIESTGNKNIMLTERGTTFGYNDLVVDFRNIPIMKEFGYPVFVDCTHSLQKPNQMSGVTGGDPRMIETMAKCAIAAGADGIFIETHPNPFKAKSDGESMLPLHELKPILEKLVKLKIALHE